MSFGKPCTIATADTKDAVHGFTALTQGDVVASANLEQLPLADDWVEVAIEACGICHTDLSIISNEWKVIQYPTCPGHEGIGRIVAVGSAVRNRKVGDRVGVGCLRNACHDCRFCLRGDQNLCERNTLLLGSGPGCFADRVRVHPLYAIPIPDALTSEDAAPLLCAGITVWAPLRKFHAGPARSVAVIGLGGLGHLAVQFAHKLGAQVTVFTRSNDKREEALRLGASRFVATSDADALKAEDSKHDIVLITSSGGSVDQYLALAARDGVLVVAGVPAAEAISAPPMLLIMKQVSIAGSSFGGIRDTAEMLDFAAKTGVRPMIQKFPFTVDGVNAGLKAVKEGTVRYRVVLTRAPIQ